MGRRRYDNAGLQRVRGARWSQQAGVQRAQRQRGLTLQLIFHPEALALDDDRIGMMQQAIQDRRGQGAVMVEDGGPVFEGAVGGQDHRPLFIAEADCCGQVKTDTQLSCLSDVFVRIGTDIPEIRMFAPTVIEHLDVIHHVIPRFLPRPIIALRCALTLQAAEKPLCDCIV